METIWRWAVLAAACLSDMKDVHGTRVFSLHVSAVKVMYGSTVEDEPQVGGWRHLTIFSRRMVSLKVRSKDGTS